MSLEINKVKPYIGFAIKSRSIKFGVDDICKIKKSELILVSDSLQESSMKKILAFSVKNHIELLKLSLDDFENLLDNKSVKAFAILDKNLAIAIKKEFND
jgi:hypothetical protein